MQAIVTGRKGNGNKRAYPEIVFLDMPSCPDADCCQRRHKTEPTRRTQNGEGIRGGRFTSITDDWGPMKPGIRVEEKTIKTGKRRVETRQSLMLENN